MWTISGSLFRVLSVCFSRDQIFAISWIPQCWEQLLWIRHVPWQYLKDDSWLDDVAILLK